MSGQQITLLALAAVLMFWTVGAYNRLMKLRNGIAGAWAKVDEALRARGVAAQALRAALQAPLAAESGALETWQAAVAEATRATSTLGARPVVLAHAAAWVAAEASQAAAASRVFALLEQHAELRAQDAVAKPAQAWHEASQRLGFARQLFNETAAPYNAAIATFPTRLLVGMFRFEAAGLI